MIIQINNKIYQPKIGLKSAKILNSFSKLNVKENADIILYCALPMQEITLKELRDQVPANSLIDVAEELYYSSWPNNEKIKELYTKAVGEIGIPPEEAEGMTEEEIELAYEGYLQKKECEANIFLLALQKAQKEDWKTISFIDEKEYSIGNEKEREAILKLINKEGK